MRSQSFTPLLIGIAGVLCLACKSPAVPDPPSVDWAKRWPESLSPPPPPPPAGGHDSELEQLPLPLSVADAHRVVTEATVYAPNGVGMGGRPMQSLAIVTLLRQPDALPLLEKAYRKAKTPGRLVMLCALRAADPERFATLSEPLRTSTEVVTRYDGCVGWEYSVGELVAEIGSDAECSQLPKSKERLLAHYH